MSRRLMVRRGLVAVAVILALAGLAGFLLYRRHHVAPGGPATAARTPPKPTLYCDFFNFMHNATIASFYFDVANARGPDPRYTELFVVENEGEKTEFGGPDQPPAPQWSYATEDTTPTISSPDGATRIVLYGLKPNVGGVFWIEAGVRSNDYRNLEGKCRQAYYTSAPTDADRKP